MTPSKNSTYEPEDVLLRRHSEWNEYHIRWRWLLDSWEGGDTYRQAIYGYDVLGQPIRNLVRHKREYPDPREAGGWGYQKDTAYRSLGTDPYANATTGDYEMRLARTPVPSLMKEAIEKHLSGIYSKEVHRETTAQAVTDWWEDIDGEGTTMDQWMVETVAPLLLAEGCLDLIFDHPQAPKDAVIATRADQMIHELDRCVAGIILPENMLWWKYVEGTHDYEECLVCELQDDARAPLRYRHWTPTEWTLYESKSKVVDKQDHNFGRVPIKRVFDRRKPRFHNVGMSRYEDIAEIQREFYNRDSELILSDTVQAHPLLQGPEDFIQEDGSIPVGPTWLLPMKKNTTGTGATYQGFNVLEFPKDGAESIRKNLSDLTDRADRAAFLTKPAGTSGTTGGTVSQSGASKRIDQSDGNDLLGKIASTLQRTEEICIAMLAMVVGDPKLIEATTIAYPKSFDLMSADDLAKAVGEFQALLSGAGACPETESELLCRLLQLMLPGLDDDRYEVMEEEIDVYVEGAASDRAKLREGMMNQANEMNDGGNPGGTNADAADGEGTDPGGPINGSARTENAGTPGGGGTPGLYA